MKRKKFTEVQTSGILREHEARTETANMARMHSLSEVKTHEERLKKTLFFNLAFARKDIASWVEDYNIARPHADLANHTPAAFPAKLTATGLYAARIDRSALRIVAQIAQTRKRLSGTLNATEWNFHGGSLIAQFSAEHPYPFVLIDDIVPRPLLTS